MSRKLTFKSARICKECGKEFYPRSGTQVYCSGPHITHCEECGKDIEYTCSPREKPRFCSTTCRESYKKKSNLMKYGVENVSQLDSVKRKISEKNRSKDVRDKREKTCLERWGTKNPSQNEEIRKKMSETMKSEQYLISREQTCLQRYGYTTPMLNPQVQEKRRQTNFKRYGCYGRSYKSSDYAAIMVDGSKSDEYMLFKSDPVNYIKTHYDSKPTVRQLEKDLGVTNTPIYDVLIENSCKDIVEHNASQIEFEVLKFLESLNLNTKIIKNDRTQIKPYELDFYMPEYKFAIECNPASTHNSSTAWFGDKKPYSYHKMKTDLCLDKGIFLFHIFGYEWILKQDIIKSMIRNILHSNFNTLGARQTYVDDNVSFDECKKFLNENHRQGNTSSSIRIGLRLKSDDSLVSVMTFGRLRSTMGRTRTSHDDYELSRFCNKLNTSVSGGASKLFKYFIDNYKFNTIVSFSDRSHTKGTMYEILGFNISSIVNPGYFWTDIYDTKFINRVSCQKRYIRNLLKDNSIDLSLTEREIMESHGYVRTYDSGLIKWTYCK